ncbi:hypothetical protein K402DRAFT_319089, partial [Aulographum hederae CBS 113979]
GFGQSGSEFKTKTTKLRKALQETLSPSLLSQYPGGFTFHYPTGPLALPTPDSSSSLTGEVSDAPVEEENYAWWRNLDVSSEYIEHPASLAKLRDCIIREGPFDGIIGFSQGACLAMMMASWCESATDADRRHALATQGIPLQERAPQGPFRFAVSFSGYRGTLKYYSGFYSPEIRTPALLVTAAWDMLVSERGSRELAGSCPHTEALSQPGAHYVPNSKEYLDVIAQFVGQA